MCNNSRGIRDRVCCILPHAPQDVLIAFTREEPGSASLCTKQTFPCDANMGFIFMRLGSASWMFSYWSGRAWHHLCASPLPPPSRLGSAAQEMRAIPGGRVCSQRADKPLSCTCDCRRRSAASFPSCFILFPVRGYQPPPVTRDMPLLSNGGGSCKTPVLQIFLCPVIHDMLMPWYSGGF